MFAPLAYTKTWAMAAAAGLSITLVPVLMGYLVRGRLRPERDNPLNRGLAAVYRPVVAFLVRRPGTVCLLALLVLASTAWPVARLGSEFMPELDEGDLMYMPTTLPGLSIGKAQELLQQTDRLIRTVPEVDTVFGKIGRAETATDPAPLEMIETVVRLKPRSEWRAGMTPERLRAELNERLDLPGVTNAWVFPIRTRIDMLSTGFKTPVGLKIAGPDLAVIEGIGQDLERILREVPGTASVYAERAAGGRYVTVDIDRVAASRYGLNIDDVQDVVRTAIGGMDVTETIEGLERYPVNLRYPRSVRDSAERLKLLPIVAPDGQQIPLQAVADVRVEDGPPMIRSENSRPNGWVYVDIEGRDLGRYVADARAAVADRLALPPGYSLHWSGQFEYMQRALERLALVVPATLAVIVLLLYLNFRSGAEVWMILGSLPMALAGGFWLLWALDYNLSIAAGVGFIALAGVAVETAVVMLVFLKQGLRLQLARAQAEGRPLAAADLDEAVTHGALRRLRPKMMTVATIFAGLLPIMFGSGTGSEVMKRIAAPMVGGMVSATLLTLVVVPAVFLLWQRRRLTRATRGE